MQLKSTIGFVTAICSHHSVDMPRGITWPHHLIQIGSKHSTIKEVITSSLEVKHLMDGWINGGCNVRKVREPAGKRVRLEKGNFIWLLHPVWRGGVSRSSQIIGAEWCTGAGSARWSPLKIRREVLYSPHRAHLFGRQLALLANIPNGLPHDSLLQEVTRALGLLPHLHLGSPRVQPWLQGHRPGIVSPEDEPHH